MKQKYYSDFVLNKVWTNNHLRIIRITKKRCTIAYSEKYFTGNYNRLIFSPILETIFLLEKILWTAEQYNIRMQFKIEMKKKNISIESISIIISKDINKKKQPARMCAYLILMCLNWIEYECLFIKKRSIYSVSPVIDMNIDESQNFPSGQSNDRFFFCCYGANMVRISKLNLSAFDSTTMCQIYMTTFLITAKYLPIYCRLSAKSIMHDDTGK